MRSFVAQQFFSGHLDVIVPMEEKLHYFTERIAIHSPITNLQLSRQL